MLCDNCGERAAAIHLTQIVDNTVTTMHLCEQCAAEKGVETGASVAKFPLGDFLASLGKAGGAEAAEGGAAVQCPACGGTLQDFRQTGRLAAPSATPPSSPTCATCCAACTGARSTSASGSSAPAAAARGPAAAAMPAPQGGEVGGGGLRVVELRRS